MSEKDDNNDYAVKASNKDNRKILLSRCIFKMSFQGREDGLELCMKKVKELFKQLQILVDRKYFILPQRGEDFSTHKCIRHHSQFPLEIANLNIHIPILFIRNGIELKTEYAQMFLGY